MMKLLKAAAEAAAPAPSSTDEVSTSSTKTTLTPASSSSTTTTTTTTGSSQPKKGLSFRQKLGMKFKLLALTQIGLQRKCDGKIWIHRNEVLQAILKDGTTPIVGFPKKKDEEEEPSESKEKKKAEQIVRILLDKADMPVLKKRPYTTEMNAKKVYKGFVWHPLVIELEKEMAEFRWGKETYDLLAEKEKILTAETDSEIFNHELHDQRRKEILHRRWTKDVYDPLKKTLGVAIDKLPWTSVEGMRHNMHKLYLQYVNTKGHAFLDTLNPKEYPMYQFPYGVPSKITTKVGPDPLSHQEKQHFEEERLILRCETGMKYRDSDLEQIKQISRPHIPLGRNSTDCNKWLQTPLRNIDSSPRIASRQRMHSCRHMSVLSDILQENQTKSKPLQDRRSVSQPAYVNVHVQTVSHRFPELQQDNSKSFVTLTHAT